MRNEVNLRTPAGRTFFNLDSTYLAVTHLSDLMRWATHKVSAGAAVGEIGLSVGHVSEGSPTGLVVAGVHGEKIE